MMQKRIALALLMGVTLLAAGCGGTQPIYNVQKSPVPAGRTATQVKQAIQRAGASLGWQIREAGPGKLTGKLLLRTHTANIDIPYNAGSYDLLYKSSVNLNSDGEVIHNRYNAWIQKLDRTIQAQLSVS